LISNDEVPFYRLRYQTRKKKSKNTNGTKRTRLEKELKNPNLLKSKPNETFRLRKSNNLVCGGIELSLAGKVQALHTSILLAHSGV